jgi:DNA-binding NarL/FixJ family response regulator
MAGGTDPREGGHRKPQPTRSDGEDAMADATILPLVTPGRNRHPQFVETAGPAALPIRIVVADGQPLVCAGLRALLEAEVDVIVIGQATDMEEATNMARDERPDVLLVDADLPGLDGVDLAQLGVNILLLSARDSYERFLSAVRAGIRGFLLKDGGLDQLADAVRSVARGEGALAPSVARQLMAEFAAQPDVRRHTPGQLEELTAREREVVALVAGGLSNREIAEYLVVSPATAKTHVSRALCKLHVRDRAQLVRLAYETGLVVARQAVSGRSGTATVVAA